jgi:hypothetical protein
MVSSGPPAPWKSGNDQSRLRRPGHGPVAADAHPRGASTAISDRASQHGLRGVVSRLRGGASRLLDDATTSSAGRGPGSGSRELGTGDLDRTGDTMTITPILSRDIG